MALARWKCVNLGNCPKADSGEEFEIAAGEHEPTCECGGALLRVGREPSRLPKLLVVVLVTLMVIVGAVLAWNKWHPPPLPPPTPKNLVLVVDGQLLNAVMVRAPGWLGDQAAKLSDDKALSFGLWACRPVEANGEVRASLSNYSLRLLPPDDFKNLRIPSAPKPDELPEKLRKGSPSFDLLSNLKSILEQTSWSSPTNRYLVIITASSAFPKSSERNSAKVNEQEVKSLADQRNVKISAIHVIVPNDLMLEDQRLAEQQLRVLSEEKGRTHYYQVHKSSTESVSTGDDFEVVTAYAEGIKTAFAQILDRVVSSGEESAKR